MYDLQVKLGKQKTPNVFDAFADTKKLPIFYIVK